MTTTTVAPPIPVPAPPERAGGPRWARPALYGLLLAVALALLLQPQRLRLRQLLLLRRRPGRQPELEGALLRFAGLRERHHRRQAARRPLADGPVGAALRAQLLGDPGPSGPDGRRHGGRAQHRRTPSLRAGRRADRGGRVRADARRRADVPLQQPGRAARPADDRHRVVRAAGAGAGADEVAAVGGGRGRVRVPDEDPPGVPDPAAAGRAVRGVRLRSRTETARPIRPVRPDDGRRRWLVGGDRGADARFLAAVRRWLGEHCSWSSPSATTALAASMARRPEASGAAGVVAAVAAAGARPASGGCSTPRSAARSPWPLPAALVLEGGRADRRHHGRRTGLRAGRRSSAGAARAAASATGSAGASFMAGIFDQGSWWPLRARLRGARGDAGWPSPVGWAAPRRAWPRPAAGTVRRDRWPRGGPGAEQRPGTGPPAMWESSSSCSPCGVLVSMIGLSAVPLPRALS
ncbi:hypothetical protein SMICM17S_01866 [Streptomyces microflavus]